ncbi:hypothetical protein EPN96_09550 [bacterium]|nr:MAG: hypothetical protein EPN96_09550 [bacterium]
MSRALEFLEKIEGARKRLMVLGIIETLFTFLAVAPLLPALVLPFCGWFGKGANTAAAVAFLLGSITGVFAALKVWKRARPLRSTGETALLIGLGDKNLADLLLTGADLSSWGEEGAEERGASEELRKLHLEKAEKSLEKVDVSAAVPLRGALAKTLAMLGTALLWVVLYNFGPVCYRDGFAMVSGKAPNPELTVGNLSVTVEYPAYTGLPPLKEAGVGGEVRGYPGSKVTLAGKLSYAVDSGVFEGPGGEEIPLAVSGDAFTVSWALMKGGVYTLAFQKSGLSAPSSFGARTITLLEDEKPAVELLEPAGDLEIAGTEAVLVAFTATDDFSVESAELVLSGAEEVRLPITVKPGSTALGTFSFLPLSYPTLGDGAYLRVEVKDSDTVQGPKIAASKSVYLTFLSRRKVESEIEGLEERLLEAMISHLGDLLENPAPDAKTVEKLRETSGDLLKLLDGLMGRVAVGMEQGFIESTALAGIEATLRDTLGQFLEDEKTEPLLVFELERDIIFLDDLIKRLRMDEALTLGDELAALQRDLFDRLQKGDDPRELSRAVDQIEKLLRELQNKLASKNGEMPDSFVNSDAVKDMQKTGLAQKLAELREALKAGDTQKAAKLAEEIMNDIQKMMDKMGESAKKSREGEMSPEMKKLKELIEKAKTALAEQEKIMGETRKASDEATKNALAEFEKKKDSFLALQEKRINEADRSAGEILQKIPPEELNRSPDPEKPLETPIKKLNEVSGSSRQTRRALRENLGEARESVRQMKENLGGLKEAAKEAVSGDSERETSIDEKGANGEKALSEVEKDLQSVLDSRKDFVPEESKKQLKELSGKEKSLSERIGEMENELAELSKKTPFVGGNLPGIAGEAKKSSGEASMKMGEGDPFGSMPKQSGTIEKLSELAKSMEEAGEGMGGEMEGPGRGGKKPGGGRAVDKSRVEIPGEKDAAELKRFREEVLKEMRGGKFPKGYEEEVERYYERLIK